MKRIVSGLTLALLLVSMLTLVFDIQPVKASGTIYIRADGSVDPPTAPIQRDGDIYTFTDNINDSIVVEKDNIVVDGAGYTLQGPYSLYGIYLSGRSNVTIKNVEIKAFNDGIRLDYSSNNSISGNNITNTDMGILLWSSSEGNSITDNICSNNRYGIYLWRSPNNNIISNNISNNSYGIRLFDSSYTYIANNHIKLNNVEGIVLSVSSNIEISDNQLVNNGIFLGRDVSSEEVSYYNTHILERNTINGKLIYYYKNANGIKVPEDAGSVIVANCTNMTVENINASFGSVGIELAYTEQSKICNTQALNNKRGIYLHFSSNNNISDNNIHNNAAGIHLYASYNNKVSNNHCSESYFGINLYVANGNNIIGNTISNATYGARITDSNENRIYHNNFMNNALQVYDLSWDYPKYSPSINTWDDGYPSGGNYWSDYTDVDFYSGSYQNETGSDGIWDHPYVIDENNKDRYPLVNPWTSTPPKPSPVYGKGIWITYIWETEGGDLNTIIGRLKFAEVKWVAIKCGDSNAYWLREDGELFEWAKNYGGFGEVIKRFHDNGIRVLGMHWVNGFDIHNEFPDVSEIDVADWILRIDGIDGLLINAENDTESGIRSYEEYLLALRNAYPNSFIAYTSFARSDGYRENLHRLFTEYCDVSMPQAYWQHRPKSPYEEIEEMEEHLGKLEDIWNGKPIIPMGQGYYYDHTLKKEMEINDETAQEMAKDIIEFCEILRDNGYLGVSLFRYGTMHWKTWDAYAECFNPQLNFAAYSPVDLIITDPDGLVISKGLNEIEGATYMEFDVDGDGDPDDLVTILYRKLGNYSIEVTPEPEATPTDTFSLEVSIRTGTIVLAENVTISEIPSEPYVFESTTQPPLSVSVSPISASVLVGQSVTFTSTVSGGYTPYTYQWYLNGAPVSGAKVSSWTFTPPTSGIYYVYLKVTDDMGNTTQSETARITVTAVPVGGYSFQIEGYTTTKPLTLYLSLVAILIVSFTMIKRKTHRKTKRS